MDYNYGQESVRNVKIFWLFFLIICLFTNSLLSQACFCGEACLHRPQGKATASSKFIFHTRCSGTQCESCNFEDVQTLKASNAAHSAEKRNTLNAPFILSNFSDYQLYVNVIKIFFSRPNRFVKVQVTPIYLQDLALLL